MHSLHLYAKRGLSQSTLTFIPHGYQSACVSLNRCDTPTQNDAYALTHHFSLFPPNLISALHTAQHFFPQPSPPSFPLPIFVILRPIKALLAYITASLSFSLPRSSALSPSISRPYTLLHAHTQTVAPLCPVTQEVVISLQAQFTLTVPNERFPTLPFPVTPPPLPLLVHSALPS